MPRGIERVDVGVDVDDGLLISEGFSPAACPPAGTVTHWDRWSR